MKVAKGDVGDFNMIKVLIKTQITLNYICIKIK